MLETTHALVSALIATRVQSPTLSYPLIFGSHYLLDIIPHWDTGTGLTSGEKTKSRAIIETLVDLGIAATLVYLFFQKGSLFSLFSLKLWGAVGVGISPDLLEAPVLFLNLHTTLLVRLKEFHDRLHHRLNFPWGFLIQLPIWGLVILATRG
jgi:hypothetical protein